MSRPARSAAPLYYVSDRGKFSFPMRLVTPSGAAVNLTGAQLTARIRGGDKYQPITVTRTNNVGGLFTVSAILTDVFDVENRQPYELIITHIDTLGNDQDYVYPLVGERL